MSELGLILLLDTLEASIWVGVQLLDLYVSGDSHTDIATGV